MIQRSYHWLAFALVLAGARAASANPAEPAGFTLHVEWDAPAGCPVRDEFVALVQKSVAVPPSTAVHIRARVKARRKQFHLELHIQTQGASGVRSFSAPRCSDLAKTAALIVALVIQPDQESDQAVSSGTGPAGPDATSSGVPGGSASGVTRMRDDEWPHPIELSKPDVAADERELAARGFAIFGLPFDLATRLTVGGDSGLLPGIAPSANLMLGAQYDRWRLEVGGSYIFEQRAPMPGDPDTGGLISLRTAWMRTCAEVYRGLARGLALASLCAGAELGRFRSTGYGNITPISRSQTHAAISSAASVAIKIQKSVYLRVDASVASMLYRPRFAICRVGSADDCVVPLETFWQPEPIIGRVQAGVEMFFR